MSTPTVKSETVGLQSPVRWLPIAIVVVSTLGGASSVARPQAVAAAPSRMSYYPEIAPATAASETAQAIVVSHRPEDVVVDQVLEFMSYRDGWDGEQALAPISSGVLDAVVFLQAAGDAALRLEPTLHADGSVLLEIDGGARGALQFRGDGAVSYAVSGHTPGRMQFNKAWPPTEVLGLLRT